MGSAASSILDPATAASARAPSRTRADKASGRGRAPSRSIQMKTVSGARPSTTARRLARHSASCSPATARTRSSPPTTNNWLGPYTCRPTADRQASRRSADSATTTAATAPSGSGRWGAVWGSHRRRHCGASVEERQSSRPLTLLSGGVGGARLARGLAAVLPSADLTVVVNVGDDEEIYGLHVSPDLDTVAYTLAGREGPQGWGVAGDTFTVMDRLGALGADTRFRVGDVDLATNLLRTAALRSGEALSAVTARLGAALGVGCRLLPATDDRLRTEVRHRRPASGWPSRTTSCCGASATRWPRCATRRRRPPGPPRGCSTPSPRRPASSSPPPTPRSPSGRSWRCPASGRRWPPLPGSIAVSPLFGGQALKGPADRVMAALGLPRGQRRGARRLRGPAHRPGGGPGRRRRPRDCLGGGAVRLHAADTRIADPAAAARFARWLVDLP